MNRFLVFPLILALAFCVLGGCSDAGKQESKVDFATDSVVQLGAFKKSNGEMCQMKVNVVVSYPVASKDSMAMRELQQVFNREVLHAPKGISQVKDAIKFYAQSLVNNNTPSQAGATRASNDTITGEIDEIDIDRLELSVIISVVYNAHNIISFCKEETIKKNNYTTSVTHHYVSLDLDSLKRITLSDLFRDDCIDQVTKSLKKQLMSDKGAGNEDELNDFGYFNLPNLTVSGNFFFTPDGITWSFDPGVIAVASVGEPTINIDYDDLMQFKGDNSLLDRF